MEARGSDWRPQQLCDRKRIDDAGIMSLQATDEGHMARLRTTGGYPGQLRKPPNKEPDATDLQLVAPSGARHSYP